MNIIHVQVKTGRYGVELIEKFVSMGMKGNLWMYISNQSFQVQQPQLYDDFFFFWLFPNGIN